MNRFLHRKEKRQLHATICYVKNLIASFAAEHPEKKVHQRRFFPLLDRTLPFKMQGLETFFQSQRCTLVHQFVKMMVEFGEIFHLGHGYYLIPPPRQVIFPVTGQAVALSCLQEPAEVGPGLIGQLSRGLLPSIPLEEWAFAEKPEDMLRRYETDLYLDPQFQPFQWFYVGSKGFCQVTDHSSFRANPDTIYLVTHRPFKQAEKKDWLIGRKTSKGWHVAKVDSGHVRRVIFGMAHRYGKYFTYRFKPYDNQHMILLLSRGIPKEERNMLALMGLPESWPNPKCYLIPLEYMADARAVLKRLRMKEVT